MKLLADKAAQYITSWRETITTNKKLKSTATVLASALLLGGFFYCLGNVIFLKTTLGYASNQNLTNLNTVVSEKLSTLFTPIAKSLAMEDETDVDFSQIVSGLVCNDEHEQLELDQDIRSLKEDYLCKGMYVANDPQVIIEQEVTPANTNLKEQIERIVKNTPMAEMIEPLSQQDQTVAAFLVGIALKESSMGVHSPRKNGRSCFNYWGIKGSINPTAGGYNCFATPTQAVEVTAERIAKYVGKNINTPAELVTRWKCGNSCAGHSPESVAGWVRDVSKYFHQINQS